MKDRKIGKAEFFWALQTICAMHRKPYSPELAQQQLAAPYSITSFLVGTQAFGFDAGLRKCKPARLHKEAFPLVAWLTQKPCAGDADQTPQPATTGEPMVAPALVLQGDAGHVLVIESGDEAPVTMPLAAFVARYCGYVSRFTPEYDAAVDPDSEEQTRQARKFGFSWFVPELLKHKKLWQEVLLGSLIIQLIALVTPLFTQAIIDKVVVHRSQSTLIVLIIGMAVFMLFSAGLSWLRQGCPQLTGVRLLTYALPRAPAPATHHYARPFEAGILHGQAVARLLQQLKSEGFVPDVVLGHPGWGETLFVKDIFPRARLVHFCEFYYHPHGADAGFDPEFPMSLDDAARIRARNALLLLGLEHCDSAVAPTAWQKRLHPKAYQHKIAVLHEGIDTELMQADPLASFTLPNGKVLRHGDPVVTYVARHLEPYRGFHSFMRALPHLLARHPDCEVVLAGGDGVSYGSKPPDAPNWRERMLAELPLDTSRVHFLGKIPYGTYRSLVQVSKVHVYLTYPFVLSWSMLEAMACGCALMASDTAPVREVIRDGENGLLVDFFDPQAITSRVGEVLAHPDNCADLRQRAARLVRERYSLGAGVAGYRRLLGLEDAQRGAA